LHSGNHVGTDVTGTAALANEVGGVVLTLGASDNTIGGTESGAGNTIAFNGGTGVATFSDAGTGNSILANAIHSNAGLGIDLSDDGVTRNDFGDGDEGPNRLQNTPVLSLVTNDGINTTIEGSLNSTSISSFRIELFSNTTCDPSDHGEGETFLGSTDVTTDGDGNARFVVTFPTGGLPGQSFAATATDADGNTSEFSRSIVEIALPVDFSAEGFYLGIPLPDGIAVRDDGSLLVVDERDPQGVFVATRGDLFDLGDAFSTTGAPPFDSPDDILLHPDGTVFVTDGNSLQTLFKIPAGGGAPTPFVTPGTIPIPNDFNPFGIALAPSTFDGPNVDPGDLIVADNAYSGDLRAVWAIDPESGDALRIAHGDVFHDGPAQVAFGPDGRLFVHENYYSPGTSRVVTLDAHGTVTPFLSDIPATHQSMCIHPVTGEVYLGLGGLGEIWRVPSTGGAPEVFASGLELFQDMAFGPDGGTLFVSVVWNVIEITGPFVVPRTVIQATVDALVALLPSGDKKTDHRIEKAIEHIRKSLAEKLWENDTTLTKKGMKAFGEQKKAVHELMKIEGSSGAISAAINSLVSAAELLAQTAIQEAVDAGGDANEITKAQKEMAKAEKEIGEDHYDKAIEHYKKAWEHAQTAMKKAPEPEVVGKLVSSTGVDPEGFSLLRNHPNPFNPVTTITYNLPQAGEVRLTLYTITGQRVAILVSGRQEVGHHEVVWDGSGFSNGIYFYRLEAGEAVETEQMLLLK